MTTHRGLILVTLAAFAVALLGGPATAGVDAGAAELQHGVGSVTTTHKEGVLDRSVEVWYAEDGRYRAVTHSLDGSQASEEVVFDGAAQTAYITDPGGELSRIVGDFTSHFAVQTSPPAGPEGEMVTRFELAANGLARHVVRETDAGSIVELRLAWKGIPYDPFVLASTQAVSETASLEAASTPTATTATPPLVPMAASTVYRNHVFLSITTYAPCVYASNARNTGNGYFRASSTWMGSCYYMDESLWNGASTGGGGQGGTCSGSWLGSGPTAAYFSSKTVDTYPDNLSPTCSNHAGWLTDWSLVVPWNGLNTG